ncbi:hypothetical protein ACFPYJ_23135 [Paenibacillus solisilvae]|uniref:Uncharacterized protein n=1 Tax=Paenibacillus solisilvae TaxID=2486751 RepID=A0ABW0W1C7_9BACL
MNNSKSDPVTVITCSRGKGLVFSFFRERTRFINILHQRYRYTSYTSYPIIRLNFCHAIIGMYRNVSLGHDETERRCCVLGP